MAAAPIHAIAPGRLGGRGAAKVFAGPHAMTAGNGNAARRCLGLAADIAAGTDPPPAAASRPQGTLRRQRRNDGADR